MENLALVTVVESAEDLEDDGFDVVECELVDGLVEASEVEGEIVKDEAEFLFAVEVLDDEVPDFDYVGVV